MKENSKIVARLNPFALGVALGTVWGVSLFITTWISFFTGYGRLFLEVLAQSIYPGYTITPGGSFLGLFYGFLDGFVSASLIGWIYNKINERWPIGKQAYKNNK